MGSKGPQFQTFSFGGGDHFDMGSTNFKQRKNRFSQGSSPFGSHFHEEPSAPLRKRPPVINDLNVGLEDICRGITKKMKLTRKLYDSNSGSYANASQVVELRIKPGMKQGTKFTFAGMGNEEPGYETPDMVFVLKEKPHNRFKRSGDDLETFVDISLKQALTGGTVIVKTLADDSLRIPFAPLSDTNSSTKITGMGMPNSKTGNHGDLIVKFNVKLPSDKGCKTHLANLL